MVSAYLALLLLVAAERLVELRISNRNAAAAFAQGGIELGQAHYTWMKVLHTGLLLGAATEVIVCHRPFSPVAGGFWLTIAACSQVLRYWCIATLGPRWNTRVIVVPGLGPVTSGPYRYLRHPNYVAVVMEGIALPMIHDAWITAAAFTILNLALLSVRIRCEEDALSHFCNYERAMAHTARFVPIRG